MYKPETIKQLFKSNETPYFTLKAKDNPYKPERFIYSNKNIADVDLSLALKMFDTQLELHGENPDQIFIVEMYKTKTGSHSSGIIGPFEFQLKGANIDQSMSPNQSGMQGISGMNDQVHNALGSLGAIYAQRDQYLRDLGKLDMERALFEQEKRQWAEKKKEEDTVLKVLKEKYESNSERVKHGLDKAFGKLLDNYLDMSAEAPKQLGAVQEDEEPVSVEETKIHEIGQTLFNALDEGKINLQIINTISTEVNHRINQYQNNGIFETTQEDNN